MPTPAEIKKALVAAGLEIYRTRGEVVHLAERVRENLLMDSGIFVHAAESKVGFVVRAQRTDFPNDGADRLFERARDLGAPALARGFREVNAEVRKIFDPGDANRTLDTWCELSYEKPVADLAAAIDVAKFVLTLEKAASR